MDKWKEFEERMNCVAVCRQCNKEFDINIVIYMDKDKGSRFCSRLCRAEYRKESSK